MPTSTPLPSAPNSNLAARRTSRRAPRRVPGRAERNLGELALLILGVALVALSFNTLLAPNQLASGGVIGLSLVLSRLFALDPALSQWLFNGAVFALALRYLGRGAAFKSVLGALLLPLFVLGSRELSPLTSNPLLGAIYGGIGVGLGLGLLFKTNSSVGGFGLLAQMLDRRFGIGVGRAILGLDGVVISLAALAFDAERAMFALIAAFVTAKVIDVVQTGLGFAKVVWVISGQTEAISHAILHDLDRGLTKLQGFGGYSGEARTILMVVVSHHEVGRLKALVKAVDPHAFTIVSDTTEVLGQGFKPHG